MKYFLTDKQTVQTMYRLHRCGQHLLKRQIPLPILRLEFNVLSFSEIWCTTTCIENICWPFFIFLTFPHQTKWWGEEFYSFIWGTCTYFYHSKFSNQIKSNAHEYDCKTKVCVCGRGGGHSSFYIYSMFWLSVCHYLEFRDRQYLNHQLWWGIPTVSADIDKNPDNNINKYRQ